MVNAGMKVRLYLPANSGVKAPANQRPEGAESRLADLGSGTARDRKGTAGMEDGSKKVLKVVKR